MLTAVFNAMAIYKCRVDRSAAPLTSGAQVNSGSKAPPMLPIEALQQRLVHRTPFPFLASYGPGTSASGSAFNSRRPSPVAWYLQTIERNKLRRRVLTSFSNELLLVMTQSLRDEVANNPICKVVVRTQQG